ncbi:MAG: hypothetical protein KDA87_27645, partial [Planctomycetales bacterium]|nr:hypothetical protein [Planctomycetales bacterium]
MDAHRILIGSARDDDTDLNAGAAYLFEYAEPPGLLGDFNGDMLLDVTDINLLTSAVDQGSVNLDFDISGNGSVGQEDRTMWVNDIFGTYFGDANLDGEFNSSDLIQVLQAALYEDDIANNASWGTGDWDGDREFSTGDLIVALQTGAYEQGPRAAVSAVPEPSSVVLLLCGLAGLCRCVHRDRTSFASAR